MKKICVVSGTRADYGLLKPLLNRIRDADALQLQLCTTGMHLSPEYGFTQDEIIMDGFAVDETVEMLVSSDSSVGISKAIGLGVIGFSMLIDVLNPIVCWCLVIAMKFWQLQLQRWLLLSPLLTCMEVSSLSP